MNVPVEKFGNRLALAPNETTDTLWDEMSLRCLSDSSLRTGQIFQILLLVVMALAFALTFRDGLSSMVARWATPDYSHGYVIPVIALYFVWRDRRPLASIGRHSGAWSGTVFVALGLVLAISSDAASGAVLAQYGLVVCLFGLALSFFGWQGLRYLWFPLAYLLFMLPVPEAVFAMLSHELRLFASQLGVTIIGWFGISVFLDATLIDLGHYKLQVVEACSGLRYLFPLMSFGLLVSYLYQGPLWHRSVFFVSTVPVAIAMNALRIGIVGVLVEHYGADLAQGFVHMSEGWLIFAICLAILYAEIWLLMRLSRVKTPLFEQLSTSVTVRQACDARPSTTARLVPLPYLATFPILLVAATAHMLLS